MPMCTRRSFLAGAGLSLAGAALRGQDGEAKFSSDVKVVNVLTTVRTKHGDIVTDLTKDDFILAEDGRRQAIRYFSRETDLPLLLGLLVDTSGSQRNVIGEEQEASFRFLDKVLREDVDRTFIVRFDYQSELLQDVTASKARLEKALDRLNLVSWYRHGGGTTLYDAVYVSSSVIMKKREGRKALVLLTDGVDHGSRMRIGDAIEAAQRADTLVYSILFDGDEGGGFGRGDFGEDGKGVLQKLSRETGGGFFEVSKKHSLDAIYAQLQEELRSQYSLGYTPDGPADNKAFRGIKVTTRRSGLVVQARSGYYR